MGERPRSSRILSDTLDLLILRSLASGPMHWYAIAQHLQRVSEDVIQVEENALQPALQRLLLGGLVVAEWGVSENNRRAQFYALTGAGLNQFIAEREEFRRVVGAIQKVLEIA